MPIQTTRGAYRVTVQSDLTGTPKTKSFDLIENIGEEPGRATSFWFLAKIYHNIGEWSSVSSAEEDFKHIAAHEFGHLILNEYGGGLIPTYSWGHKNTSTVDTQSPLPGVSIPRSGEIDLMAYYDWKMPRPAQNSPNIFFPDFPETEVKFDPNKAYHPHHLAGGFQEYWDRSVAAEQDVKGLLWLCRVRFRD
jgi:hypothetical protein